MAPADLYADASVRLLPAHPALLLLSLLWARGFAGG